MDGIKRVLSNFNDQYPHHTGPPLGDFPNNIKRWIWSTFDGERANLLCELTNGLSVFYTARGCFCCYRGFGDKADVTTISASSTAALILAIPGPTYADYIDGTVAAEATGSPLNPEEV